MLQTDKILVVDDIAAMRQLLGTVLTQLGYGNVFLVGSGEEAIEKIHQEAFSIVMLDINLPGISGLETLQQIREVNSEIFVVMVSAHHSAANVKEAIEKGVNGFIVKPYQRKKVAEVLQKYRKQTVKKGALSEIDW